ncbi:hypothetical protein PLICRDRAFT_434644 [Plicaturopsis crispa FD-325 SS-3]|uniref:Uncharacterized protein n=1 Tax=Plicaturopsis crispa FD-325 SS-3 TaxID=944288 RepID=A0A0C9SQQ7_PLICR|nr:hypothetical protein PLICRDRAFT_434644 [Plicaturopsis crispa FD-325 SS-3]
MHYRWHTSSPSSHCTPRAHEHVLPFSVSQSQKQLVLGTIHLPVLKATTCTCSLLLRFLCKSPARASTRHASTLYDTTSRYLTVPILPFRPLIVINMAQIHLWSSRITRNLEPLHANLARLQIRQRYPRHICRVLLTSARLTLSTHAPSYLKKPYRARIAGSGGRALVHLTEPWEERWLFPPSRTECWTSSRTERILGNLFYRRRGLPYARACQSSID